MTSAEHPIVVKLDELSDTANAVSYLLGFVPTESLVLAALTPPRSTIGVTVRVDLVGPDDHADLADCVADSMVRAEAEAVMVFVFTAAVPRDGALPYAELVDAVMARLAVPVREAILVGDDRLWSYTCTQPCCPPEGRPRLHDSPGTATLAAAHAFRGRALLPDRDAVTASARPIGGLAAESMRQAMARAVAARAGCGAAAFRAEARRTAQQLLAACAEAPFRLSDDDLALVGLGIHDVRLRDELVSWCLDHEERMQILTAELARKVQPPLDAPACTLRAVSAYLDGGGLVARLMLERALDSDPDYNLARLLEDTLLSQAPPAFLRKAMRETFGRAAPAGRKQRR